MHEEKNGLEIHTNADMSHQNSIWFKIKVFLDALKTYGIISTVKKMYQRVYYAFKGVDFSTQNLHDLTLAGEFTTHGTALVSTSKDFFHRVFTELEELANTKIDKKLFIDYGSGKGAALIHASQLGFEDVYGIEFAKELHDISIENIQKLGITNIHALYQDATTFIPQEDTTVIYFFNPFDTVVMLKVVDNILMQKKHFHHDVYIIYGRPTCGDILEKQFTLLGTKIHESGAVVKYFKV